MKKVLIAAVVLLTALSVIGVMSRARMKSDGK